MFFEGIRSERELVRVAADRLSVRLYLGYDLDEELPDHSSLTRIRKRYGLPTFRRFFEAIVEQCREAGLIWGKELYFDATQVKARTISQTGVFGAARTLSSDGRVTRTDTSPTGRFAVVWRRKSYPYTIKAAFGP